VPIIFHFLHFPYQALLRFKEARDLLQDFAQTEPLSLYIGESMLYMERITFNLNNPTVPASSEVQQHSTNIK
jgi:hypothetical protein